MRDDPWHIPAHFQLHTPSPGNTVLFDVETGRSWSVPVATAALVQALLAGWRPTEPPPASVQKYMTGMDPAAWAVVQADLTAEGILGSSVDPSEPWTWTDMRLPFFHLQAPRTLGSRAGTAMLVAVPVVLLACIAFAVEMLLDDTVRPLIQAWNHYQQNASGVAFFGSMASALLLVSLVHEFGHAVPLAWATGLRVPVGLRLRYLYPTAYADASGIVVLPHHWRRASVLLGGIAAEMLLWTTAVLLAGANPERAPGPVLALLLFGPVGLLVHLVPLVRNDGYWILADRLGEDDLLGDAEAAMSAFWRADAPVRRPWLPWYGLLHVHVVAGAFVVAGVSAGSALGLSTVGAVAGILAAILFLARRARRAGLALQTA